jgi:hypothetical protein
MNFYNIDFKVKYNTIQDELLDKIQLNTKSEYNEEDIFSICTNLYQHELIQVFYASSLLDDKIDKGIQKVYDNYLCNYKPFIEILDKSKKYLFISNNETNSFLSSLHKENFEKNSSYFLVLMLFSENIFYLTHQCIYQIIKKNSIDLPILINLETKLNEMLENKF